MQRAIIGFHRDEDGQWVADLECGHSQHMRHTPPFVERPWVATPQGRSRMVGVRLTCVECAKDDAATSG
jgi:hypothetical protein